jgi:hypothetical protein
MEKFWDGARIENPRVGSSILSLGTRNINKIKDLQNNKYPYTDKSAGNFI